MREHIIKGINTGFILIISSILTLSLLQDNSASLKFIQYFIPILITYIICGIIIQWIRNIPVKNSEGSQGAGIIYWIFLIMIIIPVIGSFIDLYIRYIVLTNIVVIIGLWIMDYISLGKIAEELNGRVIKRYKTLTIDLKEKPKTDEEFFKVLESYCIKEGNILEYIERDIPAIIKINGALNKAEIGYYYGVSGECVYTLKISEI